MAKDEEDGVESGYGVVADPSREDAGPADDVVGVYGRL